MTKTVKIFAIVLALAMALSLTGCSLDKQIEQTAEKASQLMNTVLENQQELLEHGTNQQNQLLENGINQQQQILEHGMNQQQELLEQGSQLQQQIIGGSTSEKKELDHAAIIDSFVSDALNTFELTVGKSHAPIAKVWLQSGKGSVYTSDDSVVTVTDLGKVTAVGEGEAYVIISASTNMYECYLYKVIAG